MYNVRRSIRVIHHYFNKLKKKRCKAIPIGAEETLDKIPHPFLILKRARERIS